MHNTLYITENNFFLFITTKVYLIVNRTYAFCLISTLGFLLQIFVAIQFSMFSSFLFSDSYNYHFFLTLL
jgi:hypothetical protein